MNAFKGTLTCACFLCTLAQFASSQTPLSFYPHAEGNVWQYRDASTQEIVYRRHNDSVWTAQDSSIYIRAKYVPGQIRQERIDTSFDLYLTTFQPDHPRYKLAADSGDTWFAGYFLGDSTRYIEVSVTGVYQGNFTFCGPSPVVVFTTMKEFTFSMIQFGGTDTIELGKEYLGADFGLLFALIEGGSAPCLSGATIDGVHWGEPIVGVKDMPHPPERFLLRQSYPNPFNPLTKIPFELAHSAHARLIVFDVLGREVAILVNANLSAGYHSATFSGNGLPSGVFFVRLQITDGEGKEIYQKTNKLILSK